MNTDVLFKQWKTSTKSILNLRKRERKKMVMASSISPHSHPILTLRLKADILDRFKETAKIKL